MTLMLLMVMMMMKHTKPLASAAAIEFNFIG